MNSDIISEKYSDLIRLSLNKKDEYINAKPFPFILLDNFFNADYLDKILDDFPDMLKSKYSYKFETRNDKKLSTTSPKIFSDNTNHFVNFLNSHKFLDFLQNLTGFKSHLIPDPYFWGGGLHEIKKGGFLKIHADYNVHPLFKLNRRINILIYLNKDWKEEWNGHLEFWNKDMSKCEYKILPNFNRIVIFNTNDFSYHGHPTPIDCPEDVSRKSLALYYYTNGRPESEINKKLPVHSTLYQNRKNSDDNVDKTMVEFKKIFGKFYIRKKTTY